MRKTIFALLAGTFALVPDLPAFDRAETLRWFAEHQFGVTPIGRPQDETFGERSVSCFGGQIKIDITCVLPEGADAKRPVPVFVFGDHFCGKAPDFAPGEYPGIPTNAITSRGYAYVRWNFNNVAPNASRGAGDLWRWPQGVISLVATGDRNATNVVRSATSWGTIGAWAWGHSRVMDWIETRPELDASRVAVVGHSRGGKTALWAGAQDTRFAMVVSNGSGCGGAKLARLGLEKAEHVRQILRGFPNWFCLNFAEWTDRDEEIAHDADDLIRLVAPRLVYVASGSEDAWAGPAAEKAAWDAAHDVWKAVGLERNMGYHVHDGPHKLRPDDWEKFMDFADARMKRRAAACNEAPDVGLDRDVPYDEPERCKLDVKWPSGRTGFPTVVWFHGGGLVKGNKNFISIDSGIAQVAVNYRLLAAGSMTNGTVCIRDAAAAVAWTLENIARYGGDPKKVYVSGMSAGGYLTMMVGMAPRYLAERGHDIRELAGLVPLSGQATKHFNVRKFSGDEDPQFLPKIDDLAPLRWCSKDIPPIVAVCGEEPWEWKCRSEENRLLISSCVALGHDRAWFVSCPYADHGRAYAAGVPYVEMFVNGRMPPALKVGKAK